MTIQKRSEEKITVNCSTMLFGIIMMMTSRDSSISVLKVGSYETFKKSGRTSSIMILSTSGTGTPFSSGKILPRQSFPTFTRTATFSFIQIQNSTEPLPLGRLREFSPFRMILGFADHAPVSIFRSETLSRPCWRMK